MNEKFRPFEYFPDSDTLEITLANAPIIKTENAGTEGEHESILFHYDEDGRISSITIDLASQNANIKEITKTHENVISSEITQIYTVSTLSEKLGIKPRTIQKTIKTMQEAGINVGLQAEPNAPIILTNLDKDKIEKWRAEHPVGKPKTVQSV